MASVEQTFEEIVEEHMKEVPVENVEVENVEEEDVDASAANTAVITQNTDAYLAELVQPYAEAIKDAVTIDKLVEWCNSVIPEDVRDSLVEALPEMEVDDAKLAIVQYIKDYITEVYKAYFPNTVVTPWTVAENRPPEVEKLLAHVDVSDTLPVTVTVGKKEYVHEMHEETFVGLMVVGNVKKGYSLTMLDTPADQSILEKYNYNETIPMEDEEYMGTVGDKVYHFKSTKFVKGVVTGAEWTKTKSQDLFKDLYQVHCDGEPTLLEY
jgi:hypothetical protein